MLSILIGAIGNAALQAYIPSLIGKAINVMMLKPPDTSALLPIALLIGASQLMRGLIQFGRNFSSEFIRQQSLAYVEKAREMVSPS